MKIWSIESPTLRSKLAYSDHPKIEEVVKEDVVPLSI